MNVSIDEYRVLVKSLYNYIRCCKSKDSDVWYDKKEVQQAQQFLDKIENAYTEKNEGGEYAETNSEKEYRESQKGACKEESCD